MTDEQFAIPMERLRAVFGERFYPPARFAVFWEELRHTESALWEAAVRRLVLEETQPPMMKQIRMALAVEREKRHQSEKVTEAKQAEQFFATRTSGCPPEVREKFAHIFKLVPKAGGES